MLWNEFLLQQLTPLLGSGGQDQVHLRASPLCIFPFPRFMEGAFEFIGGTFEGRVDIQGSLPSPASLPLRISNIVSVLFHMCCSRWSLSWRFCCDTRGFCKDRKIQTSTSDRI
ncbi:hypothetical protein M378DRAFT_739839 [Amanita muscaria Koide BX008]|uniref:Uncharacterized protein n=1 Tax=Amanita muscaria (strain Koide BX008) TaxID=946122 RepID=A0A0C2X1B7_AMAMK|nr:hypothetical protein M378DRAFT_739839 [Amanita muscaria Koide BX008]